MKAVVFGGLALALACGTFGLGTLAYAAYVWWVQSAVPWHVLSVAFLAIIAAATTTLAAEAFITPE